MLADSFA
jgi:hypothetical protein